MRHIFKLGFLRAGVAPVVAWAVAAGAPAIAQSTQTAPDEPLPRAEIQETGLSASDDEIIITAQRRAERLARRLRDA